MSTSEQKQFQNLLSTSSWSPGEREPTLYSYNTAWQKWERWCASENTDPFLASISRVLEFLTEEYKAGKSYRSLNCYIYAICCRSAISSTHLPIQGFAVGKHPLVCRLLKGTFNLLPPTPRYFQLWEVKKVLSFLEKMGDNSSL